MAKSTPELSTLVTTLEATGLVDTLKGEGPFTVFAPNNAAFVNIYPTKAKELAELLKPENVEKLKEVLLRHVVPGKIESLSFPLTSKRPSFDYKPLKTVGGEDLIVYLMDGFYAIESLPGYNLYSKVITADFVASNGVVHIVSHILF